MTSCTVFYAPNGYFSYNTNFKSIGQVFNRLNGLFSSNQNFLKQKFDKIGQFWPKKDIFLIMTSSRDDVIKKIAAISYFFVNTLRGPKNEKNNV